MLPSPSGETILVVDDEAIVLSFVTNVLLASGYKPILAVDGEQGFQRFMEQPHNIDLVLTDIDMPKLSGPDLARKIREVDQRVKLMFMTGYTATDLIAAEFSACPTLRKPFAPSRLTSAIRECLDSK